MSHLYSAAMKRIIGISRIGVVKNTAALLVLVLACGCDAKKGAVKKLVMLVFMICWCSHDIFAVESAATPLVAVHPAVPVDHLSQAQNFAVFS